jgi:integrase
MSLAPVAADYVRVGWFQGSSGPTQYLPPAQGLTLVPPLRDRSSDRAILNEYRDALRFRRLSAGTIRLRSFYADKLLEWLGEQEVSPFSATELDIERFLFGDSALFQNTQAVMLASVRTFFRWAVKSNRMTVNPAADLAPVRVRRLPSRIASDEAIAAGLSRATTSERAMILLGAECGLRVSEIASLRVSDRDGEWLHIKGKGGVQRDVWTTPDLRGALDALERGSVRGGWYFPGLSNGHVVVSTIWKHISTLVNTNPHSLRHRAGTTVYKGTGNNIRVAQEFLGHSSPTTTAVYLHVNRDDLEMAGRAAQMSGRTAN